MSGWKDFMAAALALPIVTLPLVTLLLAAPVAAQDEAPSDDRAVEEGVRVFRSNGERDQARAEAIEVQMREAEEQLAEAAARVAELSSSRLPYLARRVQGRTHPVMGITIGAEQEDGPAEGALISAVTPGSAADEAGLRAGDVITGINGESFSADDSRGANRKLLDFMEGVEEGDALDVAYLRNGRTASVEVKPRTTQAFAFRFPERGFSMRAPAVPGAPFPPEGANMFGFYVGSGSWGDMEMVSLTEDLGRYFGTDEGLLIVRAPEDENLKLRDGDVLQSIDGREPTSVSHAMRILGSYQGGEKLELQIMRDRKRQTVAVEMPDNRRSALRERAPAAVVAPRGR